MNTHTLAQNARDNLSSACRDLSCAWTEADGNPAGARENIGLAQSAIGSAIQALDKILAEPDTAPDLLAALQELEAIAGSADAYGSGRAWESALDESREQARAAIARANQA